MKILMGVGIISIEEQMQDAELKGYKVHMDTFKSREWVNDTHLHRVIVTKKETKYVPVTPCEDPFCSGGVDRTTGTSCLLCDGTGLTEDDMEVTE